MRLYCTTCVDPQPQTGTIYTKHKNWDGTQADARARRQMRKTDGMEKIETKEVDVPTDKAGLLEWLNANVKGE